MAEISRFSRSVPAAQRRRLLKSRVLPIVALAFAGACQMTADSYVLASANAYDAFGGGAGNTGNSAPVAGPTVSADSGIYNDAARGNTNFEAKSFASYGLLRGYATADSPSPQFQGFSISDAKWVIDFVVNGPGSTVTYNFGVDLDDTLSGTGGIQGWANVDGQYDLNDMSIHDSITTRNTTGYTDGSKILWETKTFAVGSEHTIGFDLSTVAGPQGGTTTADAYNTALFAMQVVTPGGGYTTANGVVFADSFQPEAPEPSTLALAIPGGIILFAILRKRRLQAE